MGNRKSHLRRIIELNRDNFCLKASVDGSGLVAIVIGSHKYYPRTFSENLKSKLQLVCADTRGFVPASANHTESDFTAGKLIQDIEGLRVSLDPRLFGTFDIASSLKAIKCQVFLALGRYDYFNLLHLWEKYRDQLSDLTIRIFEKSGHTPGLEEPDNFDEELMKWLGNKINANL